ncbi:MAG: terminase large subunit [Tepidisphaeraceae bacterium]
MPGPYDNLPTAAQLSTGLADFSAWTDGIAQPYDDIPMFDLDAHPEIDTGVRIDKCKSTTTTPARRLFVDWRAHRDAVGLLKRIPRPGTTLHCLLSGSFALFDFVPALIERCGSHIADLTIATLGFSKQNGSDLCGLLDARHVRRVGLICSYYFQKTSESIYSSVVPELLSRGQRVKAIRSHCKIIAARMAEWNEQTVQSFRMLAANTFKRSQPMTVYATNAGENRSGFAWSLHTRALDLIAGKTQDDSFLPFIFEAPETMDWRSEEAARAANPSIPDIITFDMVRPEMVKQGESKYRRLYLSQWAKSDSRWIDLERWDRCVRAFNASDFKGGPLYVGADLSLCDDWCAIAYVWPTPEKFYIGAHFWVPRVTARRYEDRDGTPYTKWAEAGDITLIDEPTIDPGVRRRIAQHVLDLAKPYNLKAIAYDSFKAEDFVAALEGAGATCVPLRQGYSISPGTYELERRLADQSIVIAPSGALRFCAKTSRRLRIARAINTRSNQMRIPRPATPASARKRSTGSSRS